MTDVDRERERDREARFTAEARFRAVFEYAPIGQVFSSMDGRLSSANEPMARMLGYTVEQMIGRPTIEFVWPADREATREEAALLREGRATKTSAMRRFRHRDGHEVSVRVVSAVLPGPEGEPAWWASMVVDLSEEERSRAEVDRARASAERSADRLHLLHAVATAANEARTLEDLVPHILEAMCTRFGWPAGALVRWSCETGSEIRRLQGPKAATHRLAAAASRLAAPDSEEPMLVYQQQPLVVVPLLSSGADRLALVFAGPVDGFDERQRDVLALVAGECRRVVEREAADQRLRQGEARFRTVFEASPFPMGLTLGNTGTYYAVNEALCRLLGRPREELLGASVREIMHPDDLGFADTAGATAAIAPGGKHQAELRLLHASGAVIVTAVTLTWLDGPDGSRLLLAQMEDITARRAAETARDSTEPVTRQHSQLDELTGLANRSGLARVLEQLSSDGSGYSILFLDLDGFKLINDLRGHTVGDEVLVHVAAGLRRAAGPADLVARFGGDAFVMVHRSEPGTSDAEAIEDAQRGAQRLRAAFTAPIRTGPGPIRVAASIGLASTHLSRDVAGPELLQRAEAAMYHAKRLGKDRVAVYDAALHDESQRYYESTVVLRDALHENRFVVHYQPIVDVVDAQIVGFEALVRLIDDAGNLVPPAAFIPVAEQSGLIVPMGEWVLRESCRTVARLRATTGRPLGIAVNVAAQQAARSDLAGTVSSALAEAGLPADSLTLELTESALLEAEPQTLKQLVSLRERGVRIALDDFGTGYSSLTYLRRFPVSHIKVDRSFVTDMTTDGGNAAIVRAVTRLAADLGLFWVAEGVETDEQWRALRELGPGFAQGYLFSRPLPADVLDHILRIENPARISCATR